MKTTKLRTVPSDATHRYRDIPADDPVYLKYFKLDDDRVYYWNGNVWCLARRYTHFRDEFQELIDAARIIPVDQGQPSRRPKCKKHLTVVK